MPGDSVVVSASHLTGLLSGATADPAFARDRARGVMLGLAVGNLLGLPVESHWHHHIAERYPGGLTEIDPDEVNRPMDDDLAQAVELAEALLAEGDLARGFADRLIAWLRENGRGCGRTTRSAILLLEQHVPPPEAARSVYEQWGRLAPNGGVMRCAPVAIARRRNPELLVRDSAATCAVTHYAPACQWSCIIINAVIALLLEGATPDLSALLAAARADGCPDLAAMAQADGIPSDTLDAIVSHRKMPEDIAWLLRDHGLIGHTLLAMQFGLWAISTPLSFEDAMIASVSVGGDTDTNAAVAGAVLGARYGASAIPQCWTDRIPQRERIERLADGLLAMAAV